MANPTPPFTDEQITQAVAQARDHMVSDLTTLARQKATGYWVPFLLQRITALEAELAEARKLTTHEGRELVWEELKAVRQQLATVTAVSSLPANQPADGIAPLETWACPRCNYLSAVSWGICSKCGRLSKNQPAEGGTDA